MAMVRACGRDGGGGCGCGCGSALLVSEEEKKSVGRSGESKCTPGKKAIWRGTSTEECSYQGKKYLTEEEESWTVVVVLQH